MRTLTRSVTLAATAGLLILAASGCSRAARKEKTLQAADKHFEASQLDEAEIEYKNVLQLEALNAQAIGRLGLIYFQEGRIGTAFAYLNKGSELQPDNLDLRIKLGTMYMTTGQLDEARKQAEYILDRRPGDAEAPMLLANSFNQKKDLDEIRQRLLKLPPPAPGGAPVLLALGTLEFRLRNLKEAEDLFRKAEAQEPNSPFVSSALASVYLAQNDKVKAEAALKKAAIFPPRSPAKLLYVTFKAQSGDVAGARSLLDAMTKATPDYLPAAVTLAQLALGEKKYDESEALLAKVFARDSTLPEAVLLSSQLALARGQNDKAVAEAERGLKSYPKSPLLSQQLGFSYLAAGQPDKARANLEQALALSPGMTDSALTLASLNFQKGDFNAAIVSLKQVVQDHPELAQAWSLLAEAHRSRGNLAEALAVYVEMDKRFSPGPQTSYFRGMISLQQKRTAEARQEFVKSLEVAPAYLPSIEQLVSLDLNDKQFSAAQQRIESAIAKDASQAGLYLLLARVQGAKGDNDGAEKSLKKAIELQPESANSYYVLAVLYYTTNQQQKALADLKDLLAKNPRDTKALMLSGVLDDEIKDYPAARDAYEKLVAVNPRFASAFNNLAYLYSERFNQLDKGYEAAQKAHVLAPQEPHISDTLGWILYKRGDYARARSLLEESSARLPAVAEVQFHLGMVNYMTGNEDSARTGLERALAIDGGFNGAATARQNLAVLTVDLSGGASARTELEKIVAEHPDDPVALTRLASAYSLGGNPAKAASTYEAALKVSPTNIKAAVALTRLYAARDETAKALELARTTRKLYPTDPEVAGLLGHLAYQTGDFKRALGLLQEAADKRTDDPEVLYDLANASYSVGRLDDAATAMQSALKASPGFANAAKATRFIELTALAGNPSQAVSASSRVDQILRTEPNDVPALMALGTISEQKTNPEAARQAYEKALAIYPDFSPAQRQLAILYSADPANSKKSLDMGLKARIAFPDDAELGRAIGLAAYREKDFNRSATWLQESAAKRPNDAVLQYYLGSARNQLKQSAQSRQALQRALDLGLPSDLAADARRILADLK